MASTDEKIFNGKDLETYSALIKQSIENVENQIPTLTSLLINNSNFVADANYVHTDNNYTSQEKTKLSGIEAGAEVNVLSDWNAVSGDAFIKNKPDNIVTDASYVHTDNNYTTAEKNKLAGIASGAEVNVQSDWNQTTTTADDYIKNKPTNVSSFNNDTGYLTSFTETDPTVPNHVKSITQLNITNWNNKADVFTINCVYDGTDIVSCDKTFALILEAYNAGKILTVVINDGFTVGLLTLFLSSGATFNVIDTTSWGIISYELTIWASNTYEIIVKDLSQPDLSSYADGAEYDSTNRLIYLKHGNTRLANPINANDFIKDGMVDTVTVTGGNLVITFNTDSGKLPITIPISDIFDANNYYNKTESDARYLLSFTETDPIYSASVAAGITSSDISNWNSKTSNIGTITGITMNGASKGTSGVVNLGTVVTSETDPVFTASAAHGITSSDITNWNNKLDSYTETDPTVPSWAKLSTKPSYDYSEINNTPTLATVATSGSYNDLSNKPTIPTVPTNVSAFTNDAGYLTTHLDISGKQDVLTAGNGIAIDNTDTIRTTGIPYGECDSTSTATAFTATVPGIYKLEDGVCVMLKNGVVTSAAGFTININGLGAKPAFNNLTAATRDTTIFNVNYTMLFVYDASRVVDNITGAWICYRGYDANTNTIGYQVRSNSMSLPASQKFYRYRLLFTSADGSHYVPANTSSSTNATASRTVNQTPIDPFGHIVYYGTTAAVEANARPAAANLWVIYTLTLGYSFNRTGAALTLDDWAPVYIKCAPQADGSAIIDADNPYVQALPTTNDGKIYIFLGVAYSATNIELLNNHPVYYHDGTGIRLWTGKDGYTKGEVDTALSGKQATLVSGTNLKTVNNTSLLGSGNVAVQPTLVSGTNIKTINNESLLGSGNITIQGGGGSDWNISVSNNILTISNQN